MAHRPGRDDEIALDDRRPAAADRGQSGGAGHLCLSPVLSDTLQIRRLCRQIDSLQSAMQEWTVRHLMEQKQIFTPSQQEKFNALMMNCCGRVPDRSANCAIHNK
jgi:Spy/CpxP family protein refolding chaperone